MKISWVSACSKHDEKHQTKQNHFSHFASSFYKKISYAKIGTDLSLFFKIAINPIVNEMIVAKNAPNVIIASGNSSLPYAFG
jgi:hypothetical protein